MTHVEPAPKPSTERKTPPPVQRVRRLEPPIAAAHRGGWSRPSPSVAAAAPWRLRGVIRTLVLAIVLVSSGCGKGTGLPDPSSLEYKEVVSAFYVGLAALQVGDDARADASFAEMTRFASGEPAGWADWGVLALRQRNFDRAMERLERARTLAPEDAHIYNLLGMLDSNRGLSNSAIANFRRAEELNPKDVRNIYALAQETERKGGPNSDQEFQTAVEKILVLDPDNLAGQLELVRIAAKRGDTATLGPALAHISAAASTWPPEVRDQLRALQAATNGPDLRSAAVKATLLRNVLWRVPEFRRGFSRTQGTARRGASTLHSIRPLGVARLQAGSGRHCDQVRRGTHCRG